MINVELKGVWWNVISGGGRIVQNGVKDENVSKYWQRLLISPDENENLRMWAKYWQTAWWECENLSKYWQRLLIPADHCQPSCHHFGSLLSLLSGSSTTWGSPTKSKRALKFVTRFQSFLSPLFSNYTIWNHHLSGTFQMALFLLCTNKLSWTMDNEL